MSEWAFLCLCVSDKREIYKLLPIFCCSVCCRKREFWVCVRVRSNSSCVYWSQPIRKVDIVSISKKDSYSFWSPSTLQYVFFFQLFALLTTLMALSFLCKFVSKLPLLFCLLCQFCFFVVSAVVTLFIQKKRKEKNNWE